MANRTVAILAAAALGAGISLPIATDGAMAAGFHKVAQACKVTSYTPSCKASVRVPSRGKFSLHIPGTHASFVGKGTSSTAGTTISLTTVPSPKPALGGIGIRIRATGAFGALRLTKGTLYRYSPSSNAVTKVHLAKHPGIYQVKGA